MTAMTYRMCGITPVSPMKRKPLSVDVHGLDRAAARKKVMDFIMSAPAGTKKITVVHGFVGGTVLRDTVRSMWHAKIADIVPDFANDGVTTIYLR